MRSIEISYVFACCRYVPNLWGTKHDEVQFAVLSLTMSTCNYCNGIFQNNSNHPHLNRNNALWSQVKNYARQIKIIQNITLRKILTNLLIHLFDGIF